MGGEMSAVQAKTLFFMYVLYTLTVSLFLHFFSFKHNSGYVLKRKEYSQTSEHFPSQV